VLQYDQGLVRLFQDGQELVVGEGSSDIQFGKLAVELVEDARIVPRDVENLEALKFLQVVGERIYQHLNRSYEDVEGVGNESEWGLQFQFHDLLLSPRWR